MKRSFRSLEKIEFSYQMKHGIWLVSLSNSQVLHLLIGQWFDKPGNIGTVEVTVYDHLLDRGLNKWVTLLQCIGSTSEALWRQTDSHTLL